MNIARRLMHPLMRSPGQATLTQQSGATCRDSSSGVAIRSRWAHEVSIRVAVLRRIGKVNEEG